MQMIGDYARWMRWHLTLVNTLVILNDRLDFESPIIRVLEVDGVPGIAGIGLFAHCKELQRCLALSSMHPWNLKKDNKKMVTE